MDYATQQDLIDRFGEPELIQLTDPENQAAIDPARIDRALADATALADGLLGKIYALPLAGCTKPDPQPGNPGATAQVPPPQLTRICCDLARYYLYDDLAPDAEVYRRYKAATVELQAIAGGSARLVCPWGGEPGAFASRGETAGETLADFAPRGIGRDVDEGYR
ncbi:MAG: DUF1320 domain-containing protein [Burkholderiaceae bacterium]|nr:MAG: DUF1320 domain-containing protein [Burkholderiaceae bacterium]